MGQSGVSFRICFGVLVLWMSGCTPDVTQDARTGTRKKVGSDNAAAEQADQDTKPRTLKVRVVSERYVDTTRTFPVATNADIFGKELKIPRLIIDKETKGLAEVFVWTGREAPVSEDNEREPVTHEMIFENGNFSPRALVMEAGDTLRFVGHPNVSTNPNMPLLGIGLPFTLQPRAHCEGIPDELSHDRTTPVFCSIHAWMRADVFVANETHCRLTDEHGECELPLPTDKTQPVILKHMHTNLGKLKLGKDSPGIQVLNDGLIRVSPGATQIEITVQVE